MKAETEKSSVRLTRRTRGKVWRRERCSVEGKRSWGRYGAEERARGDRGEGRLGGDCLTCLDLLNQR